MNRGSQKVFWAEGTENAKVLSTPDERGPFCWSKVDQGPSEMSQSPVEGVIQEKMFLFFRTNWQ